MNKVKAISDKLKEKLDTLVWEDKPFVAVFDHYTLSKSGYPYVMFECTNIAANILDNCNNNRDYIFEMFITQEVGDDRDEALQILYKWMSEVLDMIDSDYTLWWIAERWVIPTWWSIQWVVVEGWKTLVATLQLTCQTITYIK